MSVTPSRRNTIFAALLMSLALSAHCATPAPAAEPPPPDIALFMARLDLAGAKLDHVRNITPGKGSNFQPSFVPDGSAVLFVSQRSGTANIYRYTIATGATSALTQTKESLYSPTALADGSGFVAVRVVTADPYYGLEANEPPLWRFGWDGKPVGALIDTHRAAYYAWVDDQQLAMFLVDDVAERNAHKAVLVNRASGKITLLTNKPGRSLGRTPDGKRATFVDQSDPKHWVIAAKGPDDAQPQVLVDTVVGQAGEPESARSQYFVWLPDGSMLMANGSKFFRWDGVKGSAFKPFADAGQLGGVIKNIAVSRDGTQLAFSVVMAAH